MPLWKLGIIGGSGLYALDGLDQVSSLTVETPWGAPSAPLTHGTLNGVELVFLPRHGTGHRLPPSAIPFRANIAALKMAGCTDIVSVSACGSLREHLAPGHFVIVDQYVDRTEGRERSFFGEGCVAHVPMAHPVSARLAGLLAEAGEAERIPMQRGGTYVCIEGPQFSTRAESEVYRLWGMDVIGMTNMPEARLAREAELPYASIAMVTDYDCWREGEAGVDVPSVLRVMRDNTVKARALLGRLASNLSGIGRTADPDGSEHVLDTALITAPEARDPALVAKLRTVAARAL